MASSDLNFCVHTGKKKTFQIGNVLLFLFLAPAPFFFFF